MTNRPDLSKYLAHFTTNRAPIISGTENPVADVTRLSAKDRLIEILESKCIRASLVPWVKRKAVCFTECPWTSLLAHAKQYSPYGIGYEKPRVYVAGGSPVFYVRPDHWDKQNWDPHLKTFATPFAPGYRMDPSKPGHPLHNKTIDYSHEREWRIPHDFKFEYSQVEFVIVDTYEDMAEFPKPLKDGIGREKFLIMEMYKTIERLWPVHNL